MERAVPEKRDRAGSFPRYLCNMRSIPAAAGVCLLALVLVFLSYSIVGAAREKERALETARLVQASLDGELQRGMTLVKNAGARLSGVKTDAALSLVRQDFFLWPFVHLSLYDERGKVIPGKASDKTAAEQKTTPPGVFDLVRNALRGESTSALIDEDGEIRVAAVAPVKESPVSAVMISYPLAQDLLLQVKERTHADIAILIPNMALQGGEVSTFAETGGELSAQALLQVLGGGPGPVNTEVRLAGGVRQASVSLVSGDQGADAAILLVVPQMESSTLTAFVPAAGLLLLAVLTAIIAFIPLAYFQFRREMAYRASLAADLERFAREGRVAPYSSLPPYLHNALAAIAEELRKHRAITGKAEEERDEANRRLLDRCAQPGDAEELLYKTFFADAASGFFLIYEDGAFLQVNTSFASMLGYDSPAHLQAEKTSLAGLCRRPEEGTALLALLRESPRRNLVATLRRRDGNLYTVSVAAISAVSPDADSPQIIAGVIADRSIEEQNSLLLKEQEDVRKRSETLALLLASTCRQVQAYVLPFISDASCAVGTAAGAGLSAGSLGEIPPGGAPAVAATSAEHPFASSVLERVHPDDKQRILAQQSIFDDVYQIALTEAQGGQDVHTPMAVGEILEQSCRQALPVLQAQETALFREVGKDMDGQVSGSAVILRHALLRSLLEVAGPMRGGQAFISAVRDPNSPRQEGVLRLLFSASWVAEASAPELIWGQAGGTIPVVLEREIPGLPETESLSSASAAAGAQGEDDAQAAARQAAGPEASLHGLMHGYEHLDGSGLRETPAFSQEDLGFSFDERRKILQFLVQKMQGVLLQDSFTESARSVQFVAEFEGSSSQPLSDYPAEEPSFAAFRGAAAAGIPAGAGVPLGAPLAGDAAMSLRKGATGKAEGYPSLNDPFEALEYSEYGEEPNAPLAAEEDAVVHLLNMDPDGQEDDEEDDPESSLDILLIDDSLNNRLLFSMFLRDTRHRITEAHDGQEGVEAFQRQKFDVIFMDMEMPLMNGYQATRIIRAMEADAGLPPTPIVAQTAHILPDFKYQCMLSGCTEFLAKPFSKSALLTMVQAFARLKREKLHTARKAAE